MNPDFQGKGYGRMVVEAIIETARAEQRKVIRLDVLGACAAAERLYRSCGFRFIEAKNMYYKDTGWTAYRLFELEL